ncbi:CoA-binding protein [Trichothermofontia sichuanensis B231]|uniref:succinate--CoA ligase subunit alpha n=1 Tax=Trichothermofontia sichuanensis TaxID=3045816 RepID=UPI002246AA48|nr:CoA-binding protein [Trichothermofontia sichuanensis]UZQ55457.1 CoA-binding protein [Trichothermofontia sichuanensis B231]
MKFNPKSKVIVQGILEPLGQIYAPQMKAYGTNVVAGISPGGEQTEWQGIPVFDLVEQAIAANGPVDTTVILTPPYDVLDAALEALTAGIRQIIILSQGVPPMDMVRLLRRAEKLETLIVGPNSPGLIVPGQVLLGTHPPAWYQPGPVGLLSRSGTLTYEVARELTQAGLGQSIALGIGGSPLVGSSLSQWLQILDEDEQTEVIVLIGELGTDQEELAAEYIAEAIDTPVVAYLAGQSLPTLPLPSEALLPPQHRIMPFSLRTASAVDFGTPTRKLAAFKQAKIPVAQSPAQVPEWVKKVLKKKRA